MVFRLIFPQISVHFKFQVNIYFVVNILKYNEMSVKLDKGPKNINFRD